MVRFTFKMSKSSSVYKELEEAVETFKKQEPSSGDYVIFGSPMLRKEEFAGVVISTEAAKELSDTLDKMLEENTVPDAPPTPHMTAKAGEFTYAQMIDAGWTDDLLLAHGYIEEDVSF